MFPPSWFFCSWDQPLMQLGVACRRWLPPPPSFFFSYSSGDSWVLSVCVSSFPDSLTKFITTSEPSQKCLCSTSSFPPATNRIPGMYQDALMYGKPPTSFEDINTCVSFCLVRNAARSSHWLLGQVRVGVKGVWWAEWSPGCLPDAYETSTQRHSRHQMPC